MIEKSVFVDLSDYFSRIDIYGEDSIDLLDRLSTNKLDDLTDPFMGMRSVLTTNKGRIIDLLSVNRLPDKVLLMTAGESKNKVIDWIEFYTIMEDVTLKDVSTETCHFRLIGDSWEDLFPTMTDLSIHNSFIWEFEGESFIAIKLPFSPSFIHSRQPDVLDRIKGMPDAAASIAALGRPSPYDGRTKISEFRYCFSISS